jgi:hypothetical protein
VDEAQWEPDDALDAIEQRLERVRAALELAGELHRRQLQEEAEEEERARGGFKDASAAVGSEQACAADAVHGAALISPASVLTRQPSQQPQQRRRFVERKVSLSAPSSPRRSSAAAQQAAALADPAAWYVGGGAAFAAAATDALLGVAADAVAAFGTASGGSGSSGVIMSPWNRGPLLGLQDGLSSPVSADSSFLLRSGYRKQKSGRFTVFFKQPSATYDDVCGRSTATPSFTGEVAPSAAADVGGGGGSGSGDVSEDGCHDSCSSTTKPGGAFACRGGKEQRRGSCSSVGGEGVAAAGRALEADTEWIIDDDCDSPTSGGVDSPAELPLSHRSGAGAACKAAADTNNGDGAIDRVSVTSSCDSYFEVDLRASDAGRAAPNSARGLGFSTSAAGFGSRLLVSKKLSWPWAAVPAAAAAAAVKPQVDSLEGTPRRGFPRLPCVPPPSSSSSSSGIGSGCGDVGGISGDGAAETLTPVSAAGLGGCLSGRRRGSTSSARSSISGLPPPLSCPVDTSAPAASSAASTSAAAGPTALALVAEPAPEGRSAPPQPSPPPPQPSSEAITASSNNGDQLPSSEATLMVRLQVR